MPIFMDLHMVPGITAQGAAEAHRLDLQLQSQYNCTCMTYWVDESRNSAFCLIEAPDAEAVKTLHDRAHGLMTHQIIEVSKTVVESFLGRIYDPPVENITQGQLKVFTDPAFRILVMVKIVEPVILSNVIGDDDCIGYMRRFKTLTHRMSTEFRGIVAEHNENVSAIISFTSVQDALDFAISIINSFDNKESELLNLRIAISAGEPVTGSSKIFGEAIDAGTQLLYSHTPLRIVVASTVKDIMDKNHYTRYLKQISSLSGTEEKSLERLLNCLEQCCSNESFDVNSFCQMMSMSRSSLSRVSHALTGKSPNELLNEYRMEKALRLLKKRQASISEIAFATGYGSPSYFSRSFRKMYKLSPSDFSSTTR